MNPFLHPHLLRNRDACGDPVSEEMERPPAPCRSIPVTPEMQRRDAEERAKRERGNITWRRPEPLPDEVYRARPVNPARAARPKGKPAERAVRPAKPQRDLSPVGTAVRRPWNNCPNTEISMKTNAKEQEAEYTLVPVDQMPEMKHAVRTGRIVRLFNALVQAPRSQGLRVPCSSAKEAQNTITQLKAKAKAKGVVLRGGTENTVAWARLEEKADAQ